ncbi:MAG: hypothetical protein Q8O83_03010 [bacterium]|nr:hypothetical protein [bacterium]
MLFLLGCVVGEFSVSVPNEIEEAIEVKSTTNTIIRVEHIGWGGGVGVGVGAPEIKCKTAKQFLELLPKGEKIYSSVAVKNKFEYGIYWVTTDKGTSIAVESIAVKRYLAFLPEKAGILTYEIEILPKEWPDFASRGRGHIDVKSISEDEVIYTIWERS